MSVSLPPLRSYSAKDRAALWDMLRPVFRAGDTYSIDPQISEADAVAYWTGASHGAFILEESGVVLGSYYLKRNQGGGGGHVCNCGFVTAEAARGRGVARFMLDDALQRAKDVGFRAMQFNFVVETNLRAIDIWDRAGFETVGRLPQAFHHPTEGYVDARIMYKALV